MERLRCLDFTSSRMELVFAAIAPVALSFLHFGEQVVTFEKDVGHFCNNGGQDLVHSW